MIKHTLSGEYLSTRQIIDLVKELNLDIAVTDDHGDILLQGDEDHIKYLVIECLNIED